MIYVFTLVQGKIIEIHFSAMSKICGAKIQICKLIHAILSLHMCLFVISISIAITEQTYFHAFVFVMFQPYPNWNRFVGKGNFLCLIWTKCQAIMFIFCHLWHIICAVSSQELSKWPVARGRIIYFINFVLDLQISEVCFLSNLSTVLCTCILFCQQPFLVCDIFISINRVFAMGRAGHLCYLYI